MLQQQQDDGAVQLRVLEVKQVAAEQSAAEHVNLRSEQEACNKELKGQLVER